MSAAMLGPGLRPRLQRFCLCAALAVSALAANASTDVSGNSLNSVVSAPVFFPSRDSSGNILIAILPGAFAVRSASPNGTQLFSVNLFNGEVPIFEGEGSLDGEGGIEGSVDGEGIGEGSGEGEGALDSQNSADTDGDFAINLSELLRVVQLYNALGFGCDPTNEEDGYSPTSEDTVSCAPHSLDYNEQDWMINLSELLRAIQFYNIGGYIPCTGSEDDFCPQGLT